MNALDILILIFIGWGIFRGFTRGLVRQAGGFLALLAGIWLAANYAEETKKWFSFAGDVSGVVAFICIVVGTILAGYLFSFLLTKLLEKISLGPINKIGGGLFGGLKTALLLSVIFGLMVSAGKKIPAVDLNSRHHSTLYTYIGPLAPTLFPKMKKELGTLMKGSTENPQKN